MCQIKFNQIKIFTVSIRDISPFRVKARYIIKLLSYFISIVDIDSILKYQNIMNTHKYETS